MNVVYFLSFFISSMRALTPNHDNILLILIDDLRPALGCYDDPLAVTPNIDALAAKSALFTHTYTQQALCGPSRASLLTSRRPDTNRVYDLHTYWRSAGGNFTTMPQYFKESGYDAHSVGKIFHPGRASNFSDDMPYSWSRIPFHPATQRFKDAKVCDSGEDDLLCPVDVESHPLGTLPDIESAQEAIRFLKTRNSNDKPFFLGLGFHKPHVPFKFPRQYLSSHPLSKFSVPDNPHKPSRMPDIAWDPFLRIRRRQDISALNLSFPFGQMPDLETRQIIQHYYASVTYIDGLVGTVLETLKDLGLEETTVVALVGDHGWSLGEHQEWAKFSNFEVAVRTPLIIHDPSMVNQKAVNVIDEPVELLDVFPTLVDYAGLPLVPKCGRNDSHTSLFCTEGTSRIGLSKTGGMSFAFSQYPRPSLHPQRDSDEPKRKDIRYMGYSVRSPSYRYTEWVRFDSVKAEPDWDNVVAREFYDHEVDPEENHNKVGSKTYRKQVKMMHKVLKKF